MKKRACVCTLLILIIFLVSFTCVACGDKSSDNSFLIPDDLSINITVNNGDALLTTINKEMLEKAPQIKLTLATECDSGDRYNRTYVAYSLMSILQNCNCAFSPFNQVKFTSSDGKSFFYDFSNLNNAYLAIGQVINGQFVKDTSAPRLIADKTSAEQSLIIKGIVSINVYTISPETVPDYDIPLYISDIEIYNGEVLLGTINKSIFRNLTQNRITVMNNVYIAVSLTSILQKMNLIIPEFTRVRISDPFNSNDLQMDTFEHSYITLGVERYEMISYDGASPCFVQNKDTSLTDDIIKNIKKIIINPTT